MTTKPLSDHSDGRRFFNPTLPKGFAHSRREVLKMLREPRSPWPAWVENRGVPRLNEKLGADEIAITFVNHATFLIQTGGVAILTDPIWSERASPFRRIGPKRVRAPGIAFDDLPAIDIAPLGFTHVHELDWWEQVRVGDTLAVTFVPAQHFSARGLFDRQKSLWGGYVIESRGRRIYFSGDSGYSTHFADIRSRLGSPDIAMLGIGAYEPRWFMRTVHMNPAEAVRAHRDLGSRHSIGMHFGTFQLTTEAIDRPQTDLGHALAASGIAESEFITLHEGETRIY
jgi:L-ascorbate metabolism protein UlaG (beta-lactamase superfamily)